MDLFSLFSFWKDYSVSVAEWLTITMWWQQWRWLQQQEEGIGANATMLQLTTMKYRATSGSSGSTGGWEAAAAPASADERHAAGGRVISADRRHRWMVMARTVKMTKMRATKKWRNPPVPTYVLRFGWKGEVYGRYFCERIIGILSAGRDVLLVLRLPCCHACEFDAHTRITFPDLQQLLLALVL